MNKPAFMKMLRSFVKECGTQNEAARRLGVHPCYLSDLMNERRDPTVKVLTAFGLRKTIEYEKAS